MNRRRWAGVPVRVLAVGLAGLVGLAAAGCGNDGRAPQVNLDATPSETLDLVAPTRVEPTPPPDYGLAPALRVWPTSAPGAWPRTPDEAAAAFAQHMAMGEAAAEPRPAVQEGATATAELPRLREDGSPFGLASVIELEEVELDDGTLAWVVISARSPDIVVNSPAVGDVLAGGTVVAGEGQGFEGTIVVQIEDQIGLLGRVLVQGGALGENLPFETSLPFDERPAWGDFAVLTGYTTSAVDGSLSSLTMLPMRLIAGS